ncbi:DUF7351 domain-containing protein [Haladaptatus sp. NG-SE-30]
MDSNERAISPEEAFSLLGSDTRLSIVQALWKADEPLSFSELHDRVGLRDSGQFNYHLNKLVGLFVRQKDGKYELPFAGNRVIGAILSGTYTQRSSAETFELDSPCHECGTTLAATYDEETVKIRCPSCDERLSQFGFPPGAFEGRNVAELPRTFDRWVRNVFSMMADGICPNCSGRTVGSLITESEYVDPDDVVGVKFACEQCTNGVFGSVGSYLLQHSAVIAFHYQHGIDLAEHTLWELDWLLDNDPEIVSDEPLLVEYTIEFADDELELTVDDDLNVTVGDV